MTPRAVPETKHPQRHATVLGDVRLRYIDVGEESDAPPLLLLHGLASRLEEYEELVTALGPKRRMIVLDLPGNGYSDKPNRKYTLSLLEDASLALLDRLHVDRATVAGGSLGGNLALRLGLREPERFEKLAAWGPACAWWPKRVLPHVLRLISMFDWLFWPTVKVQSRFWYHPKWAGRERALEHAFKHFREVYCKGFVRMYYDLALEQISTSLFPVAARILQPTLLVWGDQDDGLGMGEGVKKLATLIPKSRLVVFEGARHALANEMPVPLARSIDGFLRDAG